MYFIQNMYEYKKVFREIEKLSKKCVHLKCATDIYISPHLSGNLYSEYYDCKKFNALNVNANTDLLILYYNMNYG